MEPEKADLKFTDWMRWPTHWKHPDIRNPGVYLLARFDSSVPAAVDPLDANVLYMGETCRQTMETRLYQFGRSAFHRKEGHSGGWTFCDKFNGGKPSDPPEWLFVTLLPIACPEPKRSARIRLVERQLLWDFVCKWNRLPECNGK